MITRTMYITASIQCCRDGDVVYAPKPREYVIRESKEEFDTSLVRWRDIRGDQAFDTVRDLGEDECRGMGTPRLCNFEFKILRVEESFEISDIETLRRLEFLRGLISTAVTKEQKEVYQKMIDKIMERVV